MARPSRSAKWTADDRTRARRELKAAGRAWKDAYQWAVGEGMDGLFPSSLNPPVAFRYLAALAAAPVPAGVGS